VAPICYILFLYTPTVIYLVRKSFIKFGKKTFLGYFVDNIVIFIFPLATNMSFYNTNTGSKQRSRRRTEKIYKLIRKTKSLEVFPKTLNNIEVKKAISASCFNLSFTEENRSEKINSSFNPMFSLHQSNVLYCFFFMAAFIILFLDIFLQISRGSGTKFKLWLLNNNFGFLTKAFYLILLLNLLLWLDFNREFKNISFKQILCFPLYPFIYLYSKIK
jgi:hypothetical protein